MMKMRIVIKRAAAIVFLARRRLRLQASSSKSHRGLRNLRLALDPLGMSLSL